MMKKNGWKAIIGVVVVIAAVIAVYSISKPENFSKDMEQLQTLADGGVETYTVEVVDSTGNSRVLEDAGKEQLVALVLAMVSESEGEIQDMTNIPVLNVKIIGTDTSFEAQLTVYDQGENTNVGLLQTTNDTYTVQNCGEVLNYLAELGFYTER